jgi:hypothetical protein
VAVVESSPAVAGAPLASTQMVVKDPEGSVGDASPAAVPEALVGRQGTCADDAPPAGLFGALKPRPDRRPKPS